MMNKLKKKLFMLLALTISIYLVGCDNNKNEITTSCITKPPKTSCETNIDKQDDIPIISEYNPITEDNEIKVSNPTGKINTKLQNQISDKEIVELKDGDCIDLNDDNVGEVIHFEISHSYSNGIDDYKLTVGNRQLKDSGENLTRNFYAARLGYNIQILVEGDGPSCDPFCDVFHYENDRLWKIGTIYCPANSIIPKNKGFCAYKRGKVLQTWYRPADYIIADNNIFGHLENTYIPLQIVEVPRDLYPMGTIVKLKCDLPLQLSRTNNDTNMLIKKGLNVILVATDDVEWVYICPLQNNSWKYPEGGWLRMKPNSYNTCLIDGKEIIADDIFNGLNCAD